MKKIKFRNNLILNLFLCFLSSILLFFSYPPFKFWYFSFFAFIPVFLVCRNNSFFNFIYGILTGFIFFSLSLSWLKNVAGPIYLLLSLYLSIYFGIFLYLIFSFDIKKIIFLGGSIYFFIEVIISNFLTGFPWLLLGLSQYKNLYILKISKFAGIYGISFLIITFNLFLFTLLKKNFSIQNLFFIFFLFFLFLICRIPEKKIYKTSLNFLLIQPNMITSKISSEENKEIIKILLNKNLKGKKVDIVVLPEGVFQDNLFENRDLMENLKDFSIQNRCSILLGTFTGKKPFFYNSAVFINGKKFDIYNKIKLVPYGEFILGERFEFIKKTFLKIAGYQPHLKKGNKYKVFEYKNVKFSSLICYENIFSEYLSYFLENGADFFIVITNDSWFGNSIGPYQHFYHNILRAVEYGRYFLQAGLTGITGVISPEGKIEKIIDKNGKNLFINGYLYFSLPIFYYETFYSKYGLYPFLIFCLFLTGIIICKN